MGWDHANGVFMYVCMYVQPYRDRVMSVYVCVCMCMYVCLGIQKQGLDWLCFVDWDHASGVYVYACMYVCMYV